MKEVVNIVIIEDNLLLLETYSELLGKEKNIFITGTFTSCEEAFKSESFINTDIVLMDINLPGIPGTEGTKIISEKFPKMKVVIITINDDDKNIFDALKAGAIGYLLKSVEPEALINSIFEIIGGGSPMSPCIARKVLDSFHPKEKKEICEKLNELELEILNHLAEGMSYKKIAEKVFLSIHGVKYHIRNIYYKLMVNSRSEAVSKGYKLNLLWKEY